MPTTTDQSSAIKSLQEKIENYEAILDEALETNSKKEGIILTDAFKHNKHLIFTVQADGKNLICSFINDGNDYFGLKTKANDLKIGTRVLLLGQLIVGTLPSALQVKKPTPKFRLIGFDQG